MKSLVSLVGTILIILGIVGFTYKYITYTTKEKVAEVGPIKVTADEEKTIFISPLVSAITLGAGLILVIVSMRK